MKKEPGERWSSKGLLGHKFISGIGDGMREREELIGMLRGMQKHSLASVIKTLDK